MPCEKYIDKKFGENSLLMIVAANEIIAEYQAQGYILTLRQLYYQFVARGLIPNKQSEYNRLGAIVNDGRLAGLIDWDAIEDRTRELEENTHWGSPEDILDSCAKQFRFDLWADQKLRPEVWIEKEALVGVVEPTCRDLDIAWFACRGYSSQSEQWRAGKRIRKNALNNGQATVILHFGDHDPSGIDMTRDNDDRLRMFANRGLSKGSLVTVKRIALNMDQVQQYNPPPNPAKTTDSRFAGYLAEYGDESWELDALEPSVIDRLIRDEVEPLIDQDKMQAAKDRQEDVRAKLSKLAEDWSEISENL